MIRLVGVLSIAIAVAWFADRYLITDTETRSRVAGIKESTRDVLDEATSALDRVVHELEPSAAKVQDADSMARASEPPALAREAKPEPQPAPEARADSDERRPVPPPEPSTPTPPETPWPAPAPPLDAFAAEATPAETEEVLPTTEMPDPLTREEVSEVQGRLDRVMDLAARRMP